MAFRNKNVNVLEGVSRNQTLPVSLKKKILTEEKKTSAGVPGR